VAAAKSRIGTKYRRVELTEWRTAPPAIDSAFMELGGITRSRIVDELGAIAFSDIGDVVDWDNETEHLQPGDPGIKDTLGVKITKVIRPRVLVIDKNKIDPRVRRAIVKLGMPDKRRVPP